MWYVTFSGMMRCLESDSENLNPLLTDVINLTHLQHFIWSQNGAHEAVLLMWDFVCVCVRGDWCFVAGDSGSSCILLQTSIYPLHLRLKMHARVQMHIYVY